MYSPKSAGLVVVCIVLLALPSVFIVLRFKVRMNTKAGIGAEEYTILGALVIQYAAAATKIYGAIDGGFGDSAVNIFTHADEAATYAKLLFAGPLLFAVAIFLIKASTLILYRRIFVTRGFGIACHIVMGLCAGWFFASVFGQIFHTKPVSNAWTKPNSTVIDYDAFLLATAVLNTILDLIVVALPLFVIRKLHMSTERKLFVSGIFFLGIFCIVASIVRLYYFVKLKETPNSTLYDVEIWSFVEPQPSMVAACLPTLAPLIRRGRDPGSIVPSIQSILPLGSSSSKKSPKQSEDQKYRSSAGGWVEFQNSKHDWQRLNTNTASSRTHAMHNEGIALTDLERQQRPADAIIVQKSFSNNFDRI